MRLCFIHPIYLPPNSEVFLRKDFDFAMYLAHAYAKTLSNFYNNNWVAMLLVLLLADAFKMVNSPPF